MPSHLRSNGIRQAGTSAFTYILQKLGFVPRKVHGVNCWVEFHREDGSVEKSYVDSFVDPFTDGWVPFQHQLALFRADLIIHERTGCFNTCHHVYERRETPAEYGVKFFEGSITYARTRYQRWVGDITGRYWSSFRSRQDKVTHIVLGEVF